MNSNFWTISRRIIAGFTIVLLVTAGLGLFALRQMESLTKNIDDLNDNVIPSLVVLAEISDHARDMMIICEQIEGETAPERMKELEKKDDALNELVEKDFKKYEPMVTNDEDRRLFADVKRTHESFVKARDRLVSVYAANQPLEVKRLKEEVFMPAYEKSVQAIDNHMEFNVKLGQSHAAAAKATADVAVHAIRVILAVALLLAGLIAFAISITTNRVLRDIAISLDHGALQTAAAARQVSMASQTLSSGASEQASSVEETSASLEEMTSMIRSTSESAQKAKSLASDSRHQAEAGSLTMKEMQVAMEAIDTSSAEVAKIVKDIDEIAFQTNILALNAAVEAARAGEAGAGFAVVADEVRSLAQRSAAAAKETAVKIEAAIGNSRNGVINSSKVSDSLKQIAEKVTSTDSLVADIAHAAREQSQGIEQINSAIAQMEKVTQSNASSAEESASAAEELSAQAETLQDLVGKLRKLVGGRGASSVENSESRRPSTSSKVSGYSSKSKARFSIPMPEDKKGMASHEDRDFRNF
jgi:methyl-accepting chemotaxis protein